VTHSFSCRAAVLLGLAAASASGAERWKMQYFYDEAKSSLTINDLHFASKTRGVAVGFIGDGRKTDPTALVTSDGGQHWALVPTKEVGVSLFFLNESKGWMVTSKGLWETTEAGRNWRKMPNPPKGLYRVHFLDENRGFGVGLRKSVWSTTDGGNHWKAVAAAAEPKANPDHTTYSWIAFATPRLGLISGWSLPPRKGEDAMPDWIEPDRAIRRSETPHLSLTLETRDGGEKWTSSVSSMFGRISRVRFGPKNFALGLIEFAAAFTWPAEVYRIDPMSGKSDRVYRDRQRAITDVWIAPSGTSYLSGTEVLGQLRTAPIPGKVKVLRSSDECRTWTEMPVDYRAVATRTTLAVIDDENAWLATDTGMILKLTK
jgi:photosystem II stability/assembly factor-like uncharacterized protein